MKKLFLLCFFAIGSFLAAESFAVPARPVKHLIKQPDGSSLEVYLRGDEFLHYYVTADGILLHQDNDGFWKYAVVSEDGSLSGGKYIARNRDLRSQAEQLYIKGIDRASLGHILNKDAAKSRERMRKVSPGEIAKPFPTTGVVRGLVILAQYQDVKFSDKATLNVFQDLVSKTGYQGDLAYGSVRDYFIDQSGGMFTPEFDVVGPVTLPKKRAFYGAGTMVGENADQMVIDACLLADKEFDVDFSRYDSNDDGSVDFVYVVYAGHGEAQGGPVESVWPQSSSLEYKYFKTLDGKYLGIYSCSSELRGRSGEEIDGIGTFCHEFSHILGLPDIYNTTYSDTPGFENWDVMDRGSYNDDSKTPAGYTAMDKYTVGWLSPDVLEDARLNVSLEALSSSNKAFFIVNPDNANEYYTLENRQLDGWDSKLPGSGLLISHIDYNRGIWNTNRVNSGASGHEHVMLVSADGNNISGEPGDVFPGTTGKTEFTDNSRPAATWWTGGEVGKPIRNIREESGVIYFDFIDAGSGVESTLSDGFKISPENSRIRIANPDCLDVSVYTVEGQRVAAFDSELSEVFVDAGIYIVKAGDNAVKVCVGK